MTFFIEILLRSAMPAKKVRTYQHAPTSFLPMGDCVYSTGHANLDGSTGVAAVPIAEFVYAFRTMDGCSGENFYQFLTR
jgi:hypothetical protein